MPKTFLGFDVGGTNIKGGLVTSQGKIIKLVSVPTQNHLGKKQIAEKVLRVTTELLAGHKKDCRAIGLGWPSQTNVCLPGKTIKKILEKKFKLPTILENDANLFAFYEALLGQGKKYSWIVGVTLGTGVGGGLIIKNKIYAGKGGTVELGHMIMNFDGPRCQCGSAGCFEEYAGSRSLARLAKKYKLANTTGQELYQLAKQHNKKALRIWKEFGRYLGLGLVSTINIFDPEIIVLGGKISQAWPFFFPSLQREIKNKAFFKTCPVKISPTKNAAIIGAALLAKQKLSNHK
jgi:glucokinase